MDMIKMHGLTLGNLVSISKTYPSVLFNYPLFLVVVQLTF